MNTISFNNGIMAKPINDNFQALDQAIRQERLNISGYGISYGLELETDKLKMCFQEGHLIDKEGYSYQINYTELVCDPPVVEAFTETCTVLSDGVILLKHMPYSTNGHSETYYDNITVMMDTVRIDVLAIISDPVQSSLKISRDYADKQVTISYFRPLERIDTVIVDSNQLAIIQGISSDSPSMRLEEGFVVSTVKIKYDALKIDEVYYAGLERINESEHIRNVYTNSDNELFLNGVKISDLGFIHFEKPVKAVTNALWFDDKTQHLYAYRYGEWIALDNRSMSQVSEFKIIPPAENPTDLRTFIFHKTDDLNMHYMAGKNELTLVIDQYVLFYDQYEELTYADMLADNELKALLPQYGYTENDTLDYGVENTGIGFRLSAPLKSASYVQAQATHRIVDANIHSRMQRSATFCHAAFIELEPHQIAFETNVPYRYGENQIQLMTTDKNLFEHFDYHEIGETKGELTTKIELAHAFSYKKRIHYRITTNIYSYDHVSSLLEQIKNE